MRDWFWARWRDLIIGFAIFLVVGALVVVPVVGYLVVGNVQVTISCQSARANIEQLEALQDISMQLGIPTHFTIPTLPEECR
jgi:hypothetical protein